MVTLKLVGTVEENRARWGSKNWPAMEEKWSSHWGGPDYQWWGSIYPRVMACLPAHTILEIATGHGRWTQYLLRFCDRFVGVDLLESCAAACRERFSDEHASFHANDGASLAMVDEADFVFSFDSLVHAELDVMSAYVGEIARILSPGGAAFIHHSNLAGQQVGQEQVRQDGSRFLPLNRWRARSVNAELVAEQCEAHGLSVRQEIIDWRPGPIDCFSLISRSGPSERRVNIRFSEEVERIAQIADIYKRRA
jgi:SAM-dependent methyltransferase